MNHDAAMPDSVPLTEPDDGLAQRIFSRCAKSFERLRHQIHGISSEFHDARRTGRGTALAQLHDMRAYDTACAGPPAVIVAENPVVYWHRELPPLDATVVSGQVVEATSGRVPRVFSRDELWALCHDDLIAEADRRIIQEVSRLHGRYAHVLHESIDTRHDDATGEIWLHGQFHFVLLR